MKLFLSLAALATTTLWAQTQYTGSISVMVGGAYGPYTNASVVHDISTQADGSLTLTIHEYTLVSTVMGDLTLGQYTISNLAYDAERGGYYRDYTNDGLTMHFRAETDGVATIDSDYTFERKGGNVLVTLAEDGSVTIINSFQPGVMPFSIVSTFVGQPEAEALPKLSDESDAASPAYDLLGHAIPATSKGWRIQSGKKSFSR